MSITGPDRGGGSSTAPTTAILSFNDQTFLHTIQTWQIVDNGGNGADTMTFIAAGRAPSDCSPGTQDNNPFTLTNGRGLVFDARLLPTLKDQCKSGGWRNFPRFKNQGDCVSFVETGR